MSSARNIDNLLKKPSGTYYAALNPIPLAPGGIVTAQPMDASYSVEIEISNISGDKISGQVSRGSGYFPDNKNKQIEGSEMVEFSLSRVCGVYR